VKKTQKKGQYSVVYRLLRPLVFGSLLSIFFIPRLAISAGNQGCFDFTKKVSELLHPPISLLVATDNSDYGKKDKGIKWGAVRATVEKPILEVYKLLIDHRNYKDMSKTKLARTQIKNPNYLDYYRVSVSVNAFAFIWIDWVEEWAYSLIEGTAELPREIRVFYQKISGTRHIKHLCGTIVLRKIGKSTSNIYFYEELKSKYQNGKGTVQHHMSTLKKLRQ